MIAVFKTTYKICDTTVSGDTDYFTITLTLSWRRLLSYRKQPINLLRKSVDWFLYDNSLRHERANSEFSIALHC